MQNKAKRLYRVSQAKSKLPLVILITTGGTIAEKIAIKKGIFVPALSGRELVRSVPSLAKIAKIRILPFTNIDSSQMTPEIWRDLSATVATVLKDKNVNGVVITHGTDTIAEAAYFLDLTIDTDRPVVFTGALRNFVSLSSDGPANLYNAIVQASTRYDYKWGVTVTLNQYVISPREACKNDANNLQAFDAGAKGYLGYIAGGKINFFHERTSRLHFALPKKLPKVILLKTYTGDDGDLLRAAMKSKAEGIVIESFGAGNVHESLYEAIKEALGKNIAVVITSSAERNGVYPIYGIKGGGGSLHKLGAIMGGDLSGPKARLLLILALAQNGNVRDKLRTYFSQRYN